MRPDIVSIRNGSADPSTNMPTYDCYVELTEPGDEESFGQVGAYQALGHTAIPYPEDAQGSAEGVILRGCGNSTGCIVGARDERCAQVYASLKPGDTCLHSTDPNAAAQIQAKASRQALMLTTASDGTTMLNLLDGKNDKVQIAAFGGIIEMTPQGITITGPGGASIVMQGDTVTVMGKLSSTGGAAQPLVLAQNFAAQFAIACAASISSLSSPTNPALQSDIITVIQTLSAQVLGLLPLYSSQVTTGQ